MDGLLTDCFTRHFLLDENLFDGNNPGRMHLGGSVPAELSLQSLPRQEIGGRRG